MCGHVAYRTGRRAAASCGKTRRVCAERIDELLRAAGAPDTPIRETAEDPPPGGPQAPPAASTEAPHDLAVVGGFVVGVNRPGFRSPSTAPRTAGLLRQSANL